MLIWILTSVAAALLLLGYIDWRRHESKHPADKFKGPAPVRFAKHILSYLFGGILEALGAL